jgi:acyl-CoA synthetase (AMP-forming)/AMP-acid ligase II
MTEIIQDAKSAYKYPLLVKQLWHAPLVQAPDQVIVYRDMKRFTYRQLRERIGRLASSLARRHRGRARLGQQSFPGSLLCRSNDGGGLADGECPAAA